MRPDPGQALLDQRIAASSVDERVAWVAQRRDLGFRLVWQQLESAGIDDPVEQASFLLRRLYPDLPHPWFQATIAALQERYVAGQWDGPKRPWMASP
jgi:hypothetical protein